MKQRRKKRHTTQIIDINGGPNITITPQLVLNKLAIHDRKGIQFVDFESILYCKAESNYTIIVLDTKTKVMACKSLK